MIRQIFRLFFNPVIDKAVKDKEQLENLMINFGEAPAQILQQMQNVAKTSKDAVK